MLFSSTIFLFMFLPIILVAYFNPILKKRKHKNIILLLASLFFYAWGEAFFVGIMLFSIFLNWFIAMQFEKHNDCELKRKFYLIFSCCYNIGLLFVFKYLTFSLNNLNLLFNRNIFNLSIPLPIGISFFTFQIMSYVIDVYHKKTAVQKNFLHVALYVSLFPQLVAGPIVRYETIEHEIGNRRENHEDFAQGVKRFVFGLGKKVLISNYLGFLADQVFGQTAQISTATAWLGIISYTLQIYHDFSGYSDMAIGLGLMFGFHLEENFNYPYIAKSITEFWRRWHISLSSWFKDYVYIPLGGNRVSKNRTIVNMLVVWLLTGIWHGANWTFVAWGLYYFVLLTLERTLKLAMNNRKAGHIYTLLFVVIGWVLFRSNTIKDAVIYLSSMLGIGTESIMDGYFVAMLSSFKWVLLAGVLFSTPFIVAIKARLRLKPAAVDAITSVSMMVVFVLSLLACTKNTYNPFIYFNF